jgi:hypothetical protein
VREPRLQPAHGIELRGGVGVLRAHPRVGGLREALIAEQFVERASDRHEAARHRQVEPLHRGEAVGIEVDQPRAAGLVALAEAVVQRGTGVADAVGQPLAAVDVTERDVVRPVERGQRNDVEAALPDLALDAGRGVDAGGEAVGDRDGAPAATRGIDADEPHRVLDRETLRADLGVGPEVAHERGLEERDAVEVHRSVLVVDGDGRARRQGVGDDVDALPQQRRLESEARRRVVVAARHHHRRTGVGECGQRAGEHAVAGCGRRSGVEHVARHDHDVDLVLAHLADENLEHAAERIERGVAVERPPDVPVRGVQDPHAHTVRSRADIAVEAGRARPTGEAVRRA